MVPKHDGARPRIPGVSANVFSDLFNSVEAPYLCMLPETWSTKDVLAKFRLPIEEEKREPLPLPDYFYPITGGIKKNFAKKKNSDGIDLSNIIPCSSVVQQNMRVTRRMLSNSVVVKVNLCQKHLFLDQLTYNMT